MLSCLVVTSAAASGRGQTDASGSLRALTGVKGLLLLSPLLSSDVALGSCLTPLGLTFLMLEMGITMSILLSYRAFEEEQI